MHICVHRSDSSSLKLKTVAALVPRHLYNDVCICVVVEFFHSIESNWNTLNGCELHFRLVIQIIAYEIKIDRRHWCVADSILKSNETIGWICSVVGSFFFLVDLFSFSVVYCMCLFACVWKCVSIYECVYRSGISKMSRKQLFICDLVQRREIGRLHRNEQHQLTEASTGLADKLLVHNNVIKVKMKHWNMACIQWAYSEWWLTAKEFYCV